MIHFKTPLQLLSVDLLAQPVRLSLAATLDRGYQGQIWVYSHEPEWLLWPLLCNCSEGHQHTSNPDFQHNTVEVCGVTACLQQCIACQEVTYQLLQKCSQVLSHVQVTFFTIAPHVAKLLQQLLLQVGITKQIQWWVTNSSLDSGHADSFHKCAFSRAA